MALPDPEHPPVPTFPEPELPVDAAKKDLLPLPGLAVPTGNDPALPEEMKALQKFAAGVLVDNAVNLQSSSQYLRSSYIILLVMYCTLFLVGLITAIAATIKGFTAKDATEAVPALVFAGLSAASFFTLFIIRPLESLERNTIFSSWVTAALNTYWTELMYFDDPKTIHTDLKGATDDLVSSLSTLSDKYAAAIGKYAPLVGAGSNPTGGGGGNQGAGGGGGQGAGGGGNPGGANG